MIDIKSVTGEVLYRSESATGIRDAVVGAVTNGANLSDANLSDANLSDADLRGATLSEADLSGAELRGADLRGADLSGADLSGAELRGADLGGATLSWATLRGADLSGATLPTGETWEVYVSEVVPALLVAGGKDLASFRAHWDCHDWTNCPMAHAFDANDLDGVPALLRPRAEQFVQFFDARLLDFEEVSR